MSLPTVKPATKLIMTMAGWTFTTPFSHSKFTGRAVDMSLLGLIIATITSIFTTINLVTTWRFLRGRGARYQRELFPIFLIALFISLRLLLLVSPILTAGFVMLLADRHFFTAFFTVRAGGDVLLFQHIFWFFGHPEVYILVIPGFGYTSTVLPYYVKKPISSKMHMVYAMHSIGCMSMVVWGHHMYLVGIDSKARTVFMTITVMIALPSTIKICGWIVSLTNGLTFPSLDLWLAVTFVSIFFVGGMSGLMVAGAGLDILLHDTYYVVGHFHVMLSGAMILSIFGWIYFNFREIFGTSYSWLFSGAHLTNHVLGHLVCFIPLMWVGYAGMPRRIQDYPYAYAGWHSVASFGHVIVLVGLLNYLLLLSHAAFYKRPLGPRGHGLPFVISRVTTIILDKYFAANSRLSTQYVGIKPIRLYLTSRD
jgi:cytochrome c oxidase subunit 1